jgi:hypothetical protein
VIARGAFAMVMNIRMRAPRFPPRLLAWVCTDITHVTHAFPSYPGSRIPSFRANNPSLTSSTHLACWDEAALSHEWHHLIAY